MASRSVAINMEVGKVVRVARFYGVGWLSSFGGGSEHI